jgi:hypothetical protein
MAQADRSRNDLHEHSFELQKIAGIFGIRMPLFWGSSVPVEKKLGA